MTWTVPGTLPRYRLVYNGHYGVSHSDFSCYEIETGQLKWTYPNNYVGVHGGHNAPPVAPRGRVPASG